VTPLIRPNQGKRFRVRHEPFTRERLEQV